MTNKEVPISFSLVGIRTLEFAIIEEAYKHRTKDKGLSIRGGFGLDDKNNIVTIVDFAIQQDEVPFIKLKVACLYKLSEESYIGLFNKENRNIILPKNFATHLIALTLGTSRGILFEKLDNTEFRDFIIPTMDISKIVNEDISISSENR